MKAKAVAFDLDGTLACLPINWEELFEEFKNIMKVEVVRPLVDTISKLDEKTRQKVFTVWDRAELAVFQNATTCKEGDALYHMFVSKPKALITMQGRAVVRRVIEKFELSFNAIVTREDSLSRIEQLRMAAEKLNVQVQDLLFVGNADSDEVAAQRIGCQFHRVK